ncbi:50S ribosomal protein L14 [Candidatus Calescamantes bacterium]|nr:50S ribosomal protein L14 [Candidatus Calescamantes bacterium]MCK5598437.1 50S ribosomal protein L14 [bacterium]
MIQRNTMVNVADNTGIKRALVIGFYGSNRSTASLGDIVALAVKKIIPNSNNTKGDIVKGVIVRIAKEIRRPDGSYIKFDDNSVVIIDDQQNPQGTRIFGPVARELRTGVNKYMKIVSLAPEVW